MGTINRGELVETLSEKLDVSAAQANRVLTAVLDALSEPLSKGDEVKLMGFGTFRVSNTKERQGRHPRTGDPITIPASRRVTFSPGSKLAGSVRGEKGK